ncbi:L-threonylcarbamoyladenylate synthase [Enorma sp.]|uniref:L-threonylcarbamoyladenylate synthase n=1 Tax=Enorma sp. TaxID=1920692 RepID=UPI0025BEF840|nr:L-threonylcarbamoyladenylate synthase [Enorma sp.]
MPEIYRIATDSAQPCDQAIAEVGNVLSSGGLALIPTETVYGLAVAVAPLAQVRTAEGAPGEPSVNGAALPPASSGYRRIFSVKQRDLTQTVPWLVGGVEDLDRYGCAVDEVTRALADAFWPGALTLIVRANDRVPRFMQAADGTVALRCSASPVVAALINACGCPLATTSANTHGMPAPAAWAAVEQRVLEGVDAAIDAGETPCQDASTIVSCVSGEVVIARYGALSEDDIQRVAKTARMRIQDRQ